jgi:hypothetical protein
MGVLYQDGLALTTILMIATNANMKIMYARVLWALPLSPIPCVKVEDGLPPDNIEAASMPWHQNLSKAVS